MAERFEAGTHDLRLATDGVWVLHAIAVFMAEADLAAVHERPEGSGRVDLTLVAAHFVDARVEGRVAAEDGVGRERA